ncbi:MAG TPA: stage II sporulation protein M [Acidimicrobiales bacterium]|nr:stage II sporulation protein M [Acidimicrobiales bacterium]
MNVSHQPPRPSAPQVARPRALSTFLRDRERSWDDLRDLVAAARGRPERLGPERLRRLGALYRAAAADLATARRRFPGDPCVTDLAGLVGQARHLVYASEIRRESVVAFLSRGYWRRVRERPVPLLVAALLLVVPAVLGAVWALDDAGAAGGLLPKAFKGVTEKQPAGADLGLSPAASAAFSARILTNNIQVAFVAFAGGITAGFLTAVAMLVNGTMVGVVAGLAFSSGNGTRLVQLIAPHGVLELSCIVVAGAAGLRMGWAIVDPGRRRRGEALAAEARCSVELVLGTALWLVVAGVVEGFVTPAGLGVGAAVAFGLALGGVFWGLVWWRGRSPGPPGTPQVTWPPDRGSSASAAAAATGGPVPSS